MERNHTPLTIGLVIPSAILSALVLLSFLLPVDCGERISLCMTILLTVMLFQQLTSEMVPRSQLPYISQYFFIIFIVQVLALVANVIIINLHLHGCNQRVPSIVKKLLSRLLCKESKRGVSVVELTSTSNDDNGATNRTNADQNVDQDTGITLDWLHMCKFLDRFFFIIFAIAFISAFIWVFEV